MISQFNFPTPVRFGLGAIHELSEHLKGYKKVLVVTDQHLIELPFVQNITTRLNNAGFALATYSDISGNPVESDVTKGVEIFKQHEADAIVIVGGGATLDVGKAIALMAHHPGSLFDYEDGRPDAREANQKFPFMVAIPTTAGTGSEVGRSSVISDNISKSKKIIFSPKMLPNLVIADPELTVDLPAAITAATGMDALTHLLEAFLAKVFHPMCDGIALEGIRLVGKSLQKAVKFPTDLKARTDMLAASLMGAVAFQKGLGVNHSCAHALSTVYDTHHGLANALVLKSCMEFNREISEEKFERIAHALGVKQGSFVPTYLGELKESIGLPSGLSELGISITDQLLDVAHTDICHLSNPRSVSRDQFKMLFQASM